jgi:hypothetical protein
MCDYFDLIFDMNLRHRGISGVRNKRSQEEVELLQNRPVTIHDCPAQIDNQMLVDILTSPKCSHLSSFYANWDSKFDTIKTLTEQCQMLTSITIDSQLCNVCDDLLVHIATHCTGLTSVDLTRCDKITDYGLTALVTANPNLSVLIVDNCSLLTNTSIIALSTHCHKLNKLSVLNCSLITDVSILSIATYCPHINSLNVTGCENITRLGVEEIVVRCVGLSELGASQSGVDRAYVSKLNEMFGSF